MVPHLLLLLCVFFLSLASQLRFIASAPPPLLNFNVANFTVDANEVELVKEGEWYTGKQDPNVDSSGTVWLTPDPRLANSTQASIVGRVVHKNPFLLPPDVSFSSFFRFTIVTNGSVGTCGSGMAFFISTSKQAPENSIAGALGLVIYQNDTKYPLLASPAPFFAIEFDTRISPAYHDISGSHIGIDLNSLVSVSVKDTNDASSPLFLYANYRFSTWVDYNAASNVIEVRANNATDRPSAPTLSYRANLSAILPSNTSLYVGFSATNRPSVVGLLGVGIHSWNFSSFSSSSSSDAGLRLRLILLTTLPLVAAAVIAVAAIISLLWKRQNSRLKKKTLASPPPLQEIQLDVTVAPRHYSYSTLRKATEGFDQRNKIGEGAHSVVYKGVLPESMTVVAIKRMKSGVVAMAEAEMRSEAKIISSIRHRNLLRLQGWCYEGKNSKREAMLVYEYISNGSLESYIYNSSRKGLLNGAARLKILKGVAAGIEYLHSGLGECILHRDVKAANVLLTEGYEAVVGDFGLARMMERGRSSVTTASIAGTVGYMAPDVVTIGKATTKGDVYSFGVLAMEVACGRRCLDAYLKEEEVYVVDWVWLLHAEGRLESAIDPDVRREWDADDAEEERRGGAGVWVGVLRLALLCCQPIAEHRPDMRHVCRSLSGMDEKTACPTLESLPCAKPPHLPLID